MKYTSNKKNPWITILAILGLLLLIGPMVLQCLLWGISRIDCVSFGGAIVYGVLMLVLCVVGGLWVMAYLNTKLVKKETIADPDADESDAANPDAVNPDADESDADESDAANPDAAEYELMLSPADKNLLKGTGIAVILVLMVYVIMLFSLWADGWMTSYTQWMEDCKMLLFWGRVTGVICLSVVVGWFAHIIYLKKQEDVVEEAEA